MEFVELQAVVWCLAVLPGNQWHWLALTTVLPKLAVASWFRFPNRARAERLQLIFREIYVQIVVTIFALPFLENGELLRGSTGITESTVTEGASGLSSFMNDASIVGLKEMADSNLDIESCIAGVKEGDEGCAVALMDHLHPLVLKLVRSYRSRRVQEEDLTQMVFLKVFTRLETYSGKVPLEHWVSRVAVNTCLNQLKADKVRPELRWSDMSEEECHVVETLHRTKSELHPSKNLAAREVVDLLLDQLKPKDRLLIQLIHLEEKSIREVQALTGWSEPVIKVRAFRARQRLKKLWRQFEFGEKHETYRSPVAAPVEGRLASA